MHEKGLQLVARQLLRGLAHAHLHGIALGLKMENILLKNAVTRDDWNEARDAPDAAIHLKIVGALAFEIGKAAMSSDIFSTGRILCFLAFRKGTPLEPLVPATRSGLS